MGPLLGLFVLPPAEALINPLRERSGLLYAGVRRLRRRQRPKPSSLMPFLTGQCRARRNTLWTSASSTRRHFGYQAPPQPHQSTKAASAQETPMQEASHFNGPLCNVRPNHRIQYPCSQESN